MKPQHWIFGALALGLVACSAGGFLPSNRIVFLTGDDGVLYESGCLGAGPPSAAGRCARTLSGGVRAGRGFFGDVPPGSYDYVVYPLGAFSEADLCAVFWGRSRCYGDAFGYYAGSYGSCAPGLLVDPSRTDATCAMSVATRGFSCEARPGRDTLGVEEVGSYRLVAYGARGNVRVEMGFEYRGDSRGGLRFARDTRPFRRRVKETIPLSATEWEVRVSYRDNTQSEAAALESRYIRQYPGGVTETFSLTDELGREAQCQLLVDLEWWD